MVRKETIIFFKEEVFDSFVLQGIWLNNKGKFISKFESKFLNLGKLKKKYFKNALKNINLICLTCNIRLENFNGVVSFRLNLQSSRRQSQAMYP